MTDKIKYPKNEELPNIYLTIIDFDGKMLGKIPRDKAMDMAQEEGLDLVMVSPNADPPVCKMVNYGKFIYEMTKKEKEKKKNQKAVETKEIRLTPNIDDNDFNIKLKSAQKFIDNKNHVKVTMRFKGREIVFMDQGIKLLQRFVNECGYTKTLTKSLLKDGKSISITI